MSRISINLDEVEGASFDLIPKGKYPATIDTVAMTDSKKGEKMLVWRLTINDGEHVGRKLIFRCMLEGEGLRFTKPILESFGFNGPLEFEADETTEYLIQPDMTGAGVTATIIHEMYEGEPRHSVRAITCSQPTMAPAAPQPAVANAQTGPAVRRFR